MTSGGAFEHGGNGGAVVGVNGNVTGGMRAARLTGPLAQPALRRSRRRAIVSFPGSGGGGGASSAGRAWRARRGGR